MNPIKLSENYFVLPQITESEMEMYRDQGFEVIVNNRPNNESEDQPLSEDLATKAAALGVEYIYNPVDLSKLSQNELDVQLDVVAQGKKTLAFCRTGTRSSVLWVLNNQVAHSFDQLVAEVNAKGFDLTRCLPAMQAFKSE